MGGFGRPMAAHITYQGSGCVPKPLASSSRAFTYRDHGHETKPLVSISDVSTHLRVHGGRQSA
eukprot:CAMPEP_0174694446 /NCGR_PEP_ID=MMETSP1094-20130205/1048_1 /TAXON_ID=156173 /ORGANISM="Chrysochromulina brevifilum, Strain UTEX LB 985" /LENGTH=62 /DNA_ID=CAMNT_0015890697 /DNA_START=415 /DNA_END=600 /DNA_ORIENTATION=+